MSKNLLLPSLSRRWVSGFAMSAAGLALVATSASVRAADVYWNSASLNWDTSTATWNTAADNTGTTQAWVNGDSAIFTTSTVSSGSYALANGGVTVDNITQNASRIQINSGTITLADTSAVYDIQTRVSGDYDVRINSVIADSGSGASSVTKNGAGILMLTGANTFSGGLAINAGTVAVESQSAAFGTGMLTLNGGNLVKSWGTGADLTIANALDVTGTTNVAIVQGQKGNFLFSGAMTGSGTFKVANTSVNGLATQAGSIGLRGDLSGFTGTIDFTSTGTTASNRLRLGVSGAGQTIDLSNATVSMSGNAGATGTSVIDMNDAASGTVKIGELNGTGGNLTVGWGGAAATTFQVGAKNTSSTFAGKIYDNVNAVGTGKAAVEKIGTGTLTLSGTNTYTGGTTISAGTLSAANTAAFGAGAVTISGGTLDLNGASVQALSGLTNLSMSSGKISLTLTSAVSFDQISGSGSFTLTGGTIDLTNSVTDYASTYQVLNFTSGGSLSGISFSNYDTTNYSASLNSSGVLSFTAVPEPHEFALAIVGLLGVMIVIRRRSQQA
jgi:autotransporter-associated beta strand protein